MPTRSPYWGVRPLSPYEPPGSVARQQRRSVDHPDTSGQLALELPPTAAPNPDEAPSPRLELARLRGVLTGLLEVRAGHRPPAQLRHLLREHVYRQLVATSHRPARRYLLRSVHAGYPAPGVCEACGLASAGSRALAVAARFEADDSGWRCSLFELVGYAQFAAGEQRGHSRPA